MKFDRKRNRKMNINTEKVQLRDITTNNIKQTIFNVIVMLIGVAATVFLTYMLIHINMLPNKYLIPSVALVIILPIILLIFIFRKKTSKKSRIVLYIVTLVISIGYFIGARYCSKMVNFLEKIEEPNLNLKTYYVIVMADSENMKISDLKGKDIGYYHNEIVNSVPALEKMESTVDANLMAYTNIDELEKALEDKEIVSMLVEDSYKIMLEESVVNFSTLTKVIYSFQIEETAETISKEVTSITTEPFSIYVSGIDTYGSIASVSRSDVNMVITVNPVTNEILLTSIPRDYYVRLHGTTGYKDKITHAGIYGVEKSVTTVEDLLDVDINYYFKVNFTSLIDIINALGGVTVYSEEAFKTTYREKNNYSFVQGDNELDGKEALAFARERKAFLQGDRMRGIHQQEVLKAIIKKASSYTIVSKFDSLLKALEGKFQTNMDYSKMQDLVRHQLASMPTWKVTTGSLNGYDARQRTYSCGTTMLYVMVPLEDSVRDARNLIQAVIKGKPTDGSYKDPANVNIPSDIIRVPTTTKTTNKESTSQPVVTTPVVTEVAPYSE